MPVAVERLAGLLKDIFGLNVIESPVAQAEFRLIDSRLDSGFAALGSATSRSAFAAAQHQYGHNFETLGAGTFALGAELQKDSRALDDAIGAVLSGDGGGAGRGRFGDLVSDIFSGQGGGSGRGHFGGAVSDIWTGQGGGSGAQADLAVLTRDLSKAGADLEVFGADIARVGQVNSREALAAAEARFHPDLQRLQDDFIGLAGDSAKFTRDLVAEWGGGGSGTSADIFSGQGGGSGFTADQLGLLRELSHFNSQFGAIGDNFGKLADIYSGGGGGSGTNADIFSGQGGGSGFAALHESFSALDGSLTGLARPLAGLLVPAVHTT